MNLYQILVISGLATVIIVAQLIYHSFKCKKEDRRNKAQYTHKMGKL